ncbi:MAG: nickel pincer cofactor biosynthesis protein LarB [Lachnospiraceae bacterium]|nr:nickel pincer cofactor biosynthesis protein LarB [Lachnospiraceae bacterium]
MQETEIRALLEEVKQGKTDITEALLKLKVEPFEELGYAKVDHHRQLRQGVQEVIYGQSKTPEQIMGIVDSMLKQGAENILISRMKPEAADYVRENMAVGDELFYDPLSRMGVVNWNRSRELAGNIVVASGGTSDMPVCEEAAITAEVLGNRVVRLYDVGVSGIHRLLAHSEILMGARVIIVVAGMEGALPSVIGGLTNCPIIAVPTSVGYGANFGGLSALLSMLNSCASGVTVVNIDNGFGAAYSASMINQLDGWSRE